MPRSSLPMLLGLALGGGTSAAADRTGLQVHPDRPPLATGPAHEGLYRFPTDSGFVELRVREAVVLHLAPGRSVPVETAESLGGRSWRVPTTTAAEAVTLAGQLDLLPGVSAFPDVQLSPRPLEEDPHRAGQWYLDDLGMDELHAHTRGDPAVRVAVIDSGIAHLHPDLVDKVVAPYDAFSDDDDPSPDPGEFCRGSSDTAICDTHGTAVAGVSVATAGNGEGIVGMCPDCSVIPIKLLGDGPGSLSAETRAFEHAIEADAAVINNSWGFTSRIPVPVTLGEVIERAATEPRDGLGAVVVFAAGNDNREVGSEEMQALESVLCVSATDSYGYPTSYTNYGPPIDVAAPSATVSITPSGELTTDFGGTSAAAPVVAGLAGWVLSVEPSLSAAEVRALLLATATPSPYVTHDEDGHHDTYGYGLLTPPAVLDALVSVDSGAPPDAPSTPAADADPSPDDSDKSSGCGVVSAPQATAAAQARRSLGLLAVVALAFRRRRPHRRRA